MPTRPCPVGPSSARRWWRSSSAVQFQRVDRAEGLHVTDDPCHDGDDAGKQQPAADQDPWVPIGPGFSCWCAPAPATSGCGRSRSPAGVALTRAGATPALDRWHAAFAPAAARAAVGPPDPRAVVCDAFRSGYAWLPGCACLWDSGLGWPMHLRAAIPANITRATKNQCRIVT